MWRSPPAHGASPSAASVVASWGSSTSRRGPGDQHAPALAHRLVDAVDLEAHPGLAHEGGGRFRCRAHDTSPSLRAKFIGWATVPRGTRRRAADTAGSQVRLALRRSQLGQFRVPTGPSAPGGTVHPPAVEVLGRGIERERQEQHRAGAEASPRALLEVAEVAGIDAGLRRHLLDAQAQLGAPPRDPPGEIPGVGRRDVVRQDRSRTYSHPSAG